MLYNPYGKEFENKYTTKFDLTEKLTGPNLQNLKSSKDLKVPSIAGGMDAFMFSEQQKFYSEQTRPDGTVEKTILSDQEMDTVIQQLKEQSTQKKNNTHKEGENK